MALGDHYPDPKPAAVCATCGEPVEKVADAVITALRIVHIRCATSRRDAA